MSWLIALISRVYHMYNDVHIFHTAIQRGFICAFIQELSRISRNLINVTNQWFAQDSFFIKDNYINRTKYLLNYKFTELR